MKEIAGSGIGSAAIAPTALFISKKRLLNKKSIEYRRKYVKDYLQPGPQDGSNQFVSRDIDA